MGRQSHGGRTVAGMLEAIDGYEPKGGRDPPASEETVMKKNRLESFSDGVFGVMAVFLMFRSAALMGIGTCMLVDAEPRAPRVQAAGS